jgi:hypothetical protein
VGADAAGSFAGATPPKPRIGPSNEAAMTNRNNVFTPREW